MQSTAVLSAAASANKRSRLVKEELLRGLDKFGKQLPVRLLAYALSYSDALDLARSQAVCSGWRLPLTFANRAWRVLYGQSWEPESAEAADIAVDGAETVVSAVRSAASDRGKLARRAVQSAGVQVRH